MTNTERREIGITADQVNYIVTQYFKSKPNNVTHVLNYGLAPASKDKIGFLADHFRLLIDVTVNATEHKLEFFIKTIKPENHNKRRYDILCKFFTKERNVIENILNNFKNDAKEPWRPNLVASYDQVMVFEDISKMGYSMLDKLIYFDSDHCRIALRTLARFHSQSVIYEESKSQNGQCPYSLQQHFSELLDPGSYREDGHWFTKGIIGTLKAIEKHSKYGEDCDLFPVIQAKWESLWMRTLKLSNPSEQIRNVLCHRDLWTNNMMFHYNDNGKPDECQILDFQAVRCQPPTADVMAFIYLNTDRNHRANHLENYISFYYDHLSDLLVRENIDIQNIWSRVEFFKSSIEMKQWALISSAALGPQIWLDDEALRRHFGNSELFAHIMLSDRRDFIMDMLKDNVYRTRVIGLLEEIIEELILN